MESGVAARQDTRRKITRTRTEDNKRDDARTNVSLEIQLKFSFLERETGTDEWMKRRLIVSGLREGGLHERWREESREIY